MKILKTMKILKPILITAIVLYLVGAFVAASFDLSHWHLAGRILLGCIFLIVSTAIIDMQNN